MRESERASKRGRGYGERVGRKSGKEKARGSTQEGERDSSGGGRDCPTLRVASEHMAQAEVLPPTPDALVVPTLSGSSAQAVQKENPFVPAEPSAAGSHVACTYLSMSVLCGMCVVCA